jgi:hypothetical protein
MSEVHQHTSEDWNYGVHIQYPFDWTLQESKSSGELINVATFISPTGLYCIAQFSIPDLTSSIELEKNFRYVSSSKDN